MSQESVEVVPGQESIVLASFRNRWAAEHMLGSLGRKFRHKARKRGTDAFVVSGNPDGSLKLTESRVLEASGLASTLIRVTGSVMVGFFGAISTLKGARGLRHASKTRASHVGLNDMKSHAILAQAGPDAAVVLVRCTDRETREAVAAKAAESAIFIWDGSLTEFLADLDPGSKHDWLRAALGAPSSANH